MSKIIYFILAILIASFQGLCCGFLAASMPILPTTIIMVLFGFTMIAGTVWMLADILSGLSR